MRGVVSTIRQIFGKKPPPALLTQIIPPDERLRHIEQNIRAITSTIDDSHDIVLHETIASGGVLTDVEIRSDRIHLQPAGRKPQLVRLDDSLESYQELEEELRLQLARKIARLVPDLAHSKKKLVLDHAVKVLKVIARDETERVRQMVAEELAELPGAPYEVVRQLAYDPSLRVSCPILEFSPLLRDEDLADIIISSSVPGVVEAIAKRSRVSSAVGDAIVKSGQPLAIRHLLHNEGAQLSAGAIEVIAEAAPHYEIWHEALVQRPELTQKTINRIAGFISQNLLSDLQQKGQLKLVHSSDTRDAVQHRLKSWTAEQERSAELRVKHLHEMGRLDEEMISTAIHEINEPFVVAALATRTGIDRAVAKRIVRSGSGRAITAISWQAGLSMRTAMALQMKIGRVHHAKMVNARGGTDYPLDPEEMQTYLDIFMG